jgi:hypothetical protein
LDDIECIVETFNGFHLVYACGKDMQPFDKKVKHDLKHQEQKDEIGEATGVSFEAPAELSFESPTPLMCHKKHTDPHKVNKSPTYFEVIKQSSIPVPGSLQNGFVVQWLTLDQFKDKVFV